MTDKKTDVPFDIARDLLFGAGAVAAAIGLSRRQVYHAAEVGNIPLFKIGATICARRSTLAGWFAERERSSYPAVWDDPAVSEAPTEAPDAEDGGSRPYSAEDAGRHLPPRKASRKVRSRMSENRAKPTPCPPDAIALSSMTMGRRWRTDDSGRRRTGPSK